MENKGANSKTTADLFKAGTLEPCIHSYMIKEAIADGNVLRFSVEYMRNLNITHIPNGLNIDPGKIDDAEYCKRNGIDITKLYHEEERLEKIAIDILEHLEQHVHPEGKDVYTALFAIDRVDTLLRYYEYLKKHNDKGYRIAAIFHCQPNEDMEDGCDETTMDKFAKMIDEYNEMFQTS